MGAGWGDILDFVPRGHSSEPLAGGGDAPEAAVSRGSDGSRHGLGTRCVPLTCNGPQHPCRWVKTPWTQLSRMSDGAGIGAQIVKENTSLAERTVRTRVDPLPWTSGFSGSPPLLPLD